MPKENVGREGRERGRTGSGRARTQETPPKKSLLAFPTVTGFVPGLTGLGQGWWWW